MPGPVIFKELYYRGDRAYQLHYRATECTDARLLIVCLHGYGGNASAWDETLAILNDGATDFVTIDLPQHGLSSRVENVDDITLLGLLEDMRSIIDLVKKSHHKEVIVIGHCFGGIISTLFVSAHPQVAKKLILINSGYTLPPFLKCLTDKRLRGPILGISSRLPAWHFHGMTSYAKFKNTSDFSMPRLLTDLASVGPRYYFLLGALIADIDLTKTIQTINLPVCIIISEKDRVFPPSYSRRFAEFFKNHQMVMLPDLNHISIINNPAQVAASVEQFIHPSK